MTPTDKQNTILVMKVKTKLFLASKKNGEISNAEELAIHYGVKYPQLRHALGPKMHPPLRGDYLRYMLDFVKNNKPIKKIIKDNLQVCGISK